MFTFFLTHLNMQISSDWGGFILNCSAYLSRVIIEFVGGGHAVNGKHQNFTRQAVCSGAQSEKQKPSHLIVLSINLNAFKCLVEKGFEHHFLDSVKKYMYQGFL